MNSRQERLFRELSADEYRTSIDIAKKLNVSNKTVLTWIKELNDIIAGHGVRIISKQKYGHKLEIYHSDLYKKFCEEMNQPDREYIPYTSEERVSFLLAYLLNRGNYCKLDDLSDFLYISRNTLTTDLKKAESILNMYHLQIIRRPNYGIIVNGSELNKRICIANTVTKRKDLLPDDTKKGVSLQAIGGIVLKVFNYHKINISEIALYSLIMHVYVAISRIRHGCQMTKDEINSMKVETLVSDVSLIAAQEIAQEIEKSMKVPLDEGEVLYLALHVGTKISSDSYKKHKPNVVISSKIDDLVRQMLHAVYNGFKIDFRKNLELRMSLNQHLVPLDIRIQYGIPLKNPMLKEIKRKYAFAYTIAATACTILNQFYGVKLKEDEIGYIAVIFALALEKGDKKIDKKNIVVVCVSGKGSSRLFMYKYRQAFGRYINQIYECSIYDLEAFDFREKDIDYVFTTIPINVSVPVPIFEVSLILEHEDIEAYQEVFQSVKSEFIHRYYREELFLSGIKASNKEEVIRHLCLHAGKYYELPEGFYDAIMIRENAGQTDFGNYTAIPHPYKVMTKESFVVVGILEEPIWWGQNEVQAVFLVSISAKEEEEEDLEKFYQLTTNLLFDDIAIKELIASPDFGHFLTLLKNSTRI